MQDHPADSMEKNQACRPTLHHTRALPCRFSPSWIWQEETRRGKRVSQIKFFLILKALNRSEASGKRGICDWYLQYIDIDCGKMIEPLDYWMAPRSSNECRSNSSLPKSHSFLLLKDLVFHHSYYELVSCLACNWVMGKQSPEWPKSVSRAVPGFKESLRSVGNQVTPLCTCKSTCVP